MSVERGRILTVSPESSQEVRAGVLRIDAGGSTVLPGFTDTHCHPFDVGWSKRVVDLRGASNLTAFRLRISARAARAGPGEWIVGSGWDQEALAEARMPAKEDIDDLTPNNPVILSRICGHIALLNSVAVEKLGLASSSGPEYPRREDGTLTGIIREGALVEAYSKIGGPSQTEVLGDLLSALREAERVGLTTLHCIISQDDFKAQLQALLQLKERRESGPRLRMYIPPTAIDYALETGIDRRFDGERFRVNGVKIFADGSLGARTAALREPYDDEPGNSGMLRYGDEELCSTIQKVDSLGYQAIVHAIGDRAVEQALAAFSTLDPSSRRRHRLEHASLCPADLRSSMARLGIRAAVQPQFVVSDSWATKRVGEERLRDLYPFKSMIQAGITVSGGSDAPVEGLNPIIGMWAACTRGGQTPEERLSLAEAIDLYTNAAAENGLDEKDCGIRHGAWGDLVVLDSDIRDMHPAMFRKVGIAATIVGGYVVHSNEGAA